MEQFKVGGAVRDRLLGLKPKEVDWVVVNGSADALLGQGYKSVGKSFPVFLHPKSGEEYALARTERKTGQGYHGFSFNTDQTVTLEEDLSRRDLTINAIAEDGQGDIIDPYHGQDDLKARLLRHVSAAFSEDPLRVLRVCRFKAQLNLFGFQIAQETQRLMRRIVESGELEALTPERVWLETEKALVTTKPSLYFEALRQVGALKVIFPEIDALFGIPQPAKHHPEIDCGLHTMMVLDAAASLNASNEVRFAALTHDLGKATTSAALLPKHHGHEQRSVKLVEKLSARLAVSRRYRDLAVLAAAHHGRIHRAFELRPSKIVEILETVDAFRRPQRFNDLLLACEADSRGRTGFEDRAYPQRQFLENALVAANNINMTQLLEGVEGPAIAEKIRQARLDQVAQYKAAYDQANA